MRRFNWNDEKNAELKRERGLTFDEVIFQIEHGNLLDILEHRYPLKFPGQRVFMVRVGNYTYEVPFVETEEEYFLKTIIPSRRATRKYI